jgi:hypothetical protein
MVNEKSNRDKSIAVLSIAILVVDLFFIFCGVGATILTRRHFLAILQEFGTDNLPIITEFLIVSIPAVVYCIFIASVILILVLKELFIRARMVTLIVNIVVGIAAIAYIPVYIAALYLPIMGLK